jgi:hypothetical protein
MKRADLDLLPLLANVLDKVIDRLSVGKVAAADLSKLQTITTRFEVISRRLGELLKQAGGV